MNKSKAECGRLGGLRTLERHGVEGMRERGARGGRPRSLTLSEIKRRESQAAENKLKEVFKGRGNHRRANKERGCRCVSR
jgi:hypothetical protein